MAELLLDSDIRLWVFLPIVVITFLVGIIRHYVTILLSTEKKVELQQISDRYISASACFCYGSKRWVILQLTTAGLPNVALTRSGSGKSGSADLQMLRQD